MANPIRTNTERLEDHNHFCHTGCFLTCVMALANVAGDRVSSDYLGFTDACGYCLDAPEYISSGSSRPAKYFSSMGSYETR